MLTFPPLRAPLCNLPPNSTSALSALHQGVVRLPGEGGQQQTFTAELLVDGQSRALGTIQVAELHKVSRGREGLCSFFCERIWAAGAQQNSKAAQFASVQVPTCAHTITCCSACCPCCLDGCDSLLLASPLIRCADRQPGGAHV